MILILTLFAVESIKLFSLTSHKPGLNAQDTVKEYVLPRLAHLKSLVENEVIVFDNTEFQIILVVHM